MSDKGIIFSAPMVRALLDGRKTQTRRLLKKPVPPGDADEIRAWFAPPEIPAEGIPNQWAGSGLWAVQQMRGEPGELGYKGGYNRYCGPLPYRPGDRLYVREAHAIVGSTDPGWVLYRASGYEAECERHGFDAPPPESEVRWRPSIHMPRWASRLTLIVTDVRVQRVQDISEADAVAEGCPGRLGPAPDFPDEWDPTPVEEFRDLWNSLYAKPGETWADNPWIVAISFDVKHGNIDQLARAS